MDPIELSQLKSKMLGTNKDTKSLGFVRNSLSSTTQTSYSRVTETQIPDAGD